MAAKTFLAEAPSMHSRRRQKIGIEQPLRITLIYVTLRNTIKVPCLPRPSSILIPDPHRTWNSEQCRVHHLINGHDHRNWQQLMERTEVTTRHSQTEAMKITRGGVFTKGGAFDMFWTCRPRIRGIPTHRNFCLASMRLMEAYCL